MSDESRPADRPGPERLAKFLEVEKGYTAEQANALVRKYPLLVARYIMGGDFILGGIAMVIAMKESEAVGSPPDVPPA